MTPVHVVRLCEFESRLHFVHLTFSCVKFKIVLIGFLKIQSKLKKKKKHIHSTYIRSLFLLDYIIDNLSLNSGFLQGSREFFEECGLNWLFSFSRSALYAVAYGRAYNFRWIDAKGLGFGP